MGREVRMVPKDWQHPKDERGNYRPMFDGGYAEAAAEFVQLVIEKGLQEAVDWLGQAPDKGDYMPDWPELERTHLMMYETCSEGTPLSPAFATPVRAGVRHPWDTSYPRGDTYILKLGGLDGIRVA